MEAEDVLIKKHGDIPVAILRIAGVYDDKGHSIPICQQISRIYEKQFESYFFPGNAKHGQPFVHMEDLIDCFKKVIENRTKLNPLEIFLIAEPDLVSYAVLQDMIGEYVHGKEWPTIRIPKFVAKAGAWVQDKIARGDEATFIKPWMIDLADAHYPVKIDHAHQKLGWLPHHHLANTLPIIIRNLKRDPVCWYRENKLTLPEGLGPVKKKNRFQKSAQGEERPSP